MSNTLLSKNDSILGHAVITSRTSNLTTKSEGFYQNWLNFIWQFREKSSGRKPRSNFLDQVLVMAQQIYIHFLSSLFEKNFMYFIHWCLGSFCRGNNLQDLQQEEALME